MKDKIIIYISVILLVICVVAGGYSAAVLYAKNKNKNSDAASESLGIETVDMVQKDGEKEEPLNSMSADVLASSVINPGEKESASLQQDKDSSSGKTADKTKQNPDKKKEEYVDITDMEKAKAKGLVDLMQVDTAQLENYFKSYPISDELFDRIYGDDRSFKTYCTVPRESLVYIKVLHYDYKGQVRIGELIASADISDDLLYIFQTLFENKYQIEKMVLVEEYGADDDTSVNDNNTSCFNFRYATDSTVLSNHATGRAIDINPLQNPYFRVYEDGSYDWDNVDAELYWDRSNDPENRHMINHDDLCFQLFTERGFAWGGDWQNPIDYQHFEK